MGSLKEVAVVTLWEHHSLTQKKNREEDKKIRYIYPKGEHIFYNDFGGIFATLRMLEAKKNVFF